MYVILRVLKKYVIILIESKQERMVCEHAGAVDVINRRK